MGKSIYGEHLIAPSGCLTYSKEYWQPENHSQYEIIISVKLEKYGLFNRSKSVKVFSFTNFGSGIALEARHGCSAHYPGFAIAYSAGAGHCIVDSLRFPRASSFQAGTYWPSWPVFFVF
jgi:hypothetical protein